MSVKKLKTEAKFERTTCLKQKKISLISKGIRISRKYPDPKYPLFLFQSCCRTITLQRPKRGPNLSFFSFLPCNWVFFFFCMVLVVVEKRVFLVCFYVLKLLSLNVVSQYLYLIGIWVLVDMSKWFFY